MKNSLLFLLLIISFSSSGQKITLGELTNLCNRKNWEDVNQFLLAKGWTFYDSKKGNSDEYNTITWSFNKDYYSDKAQAWIYLYAFDGLPNKMAYTVFNKESYTVFQKSIQSEGFRFSKNEIEDNEIISTYNNSYYTLIISTEKRETEDDYYSESPSLTVYNIELIKKAGIYDSDNGKKTSESEDGKLIEYFLLNGKLNGQIKVYHKNGVLYKQGNYSNNLPNGLFKEFDETGKLIAEYTMVDGKKNGALKIYENDKITLLSTFKDDRKMGQQIEYYYNENSGKLQLKRIGNYFEDERNGIWKLFYINERNTEILSDFENYSRGLKNGKFRYVIGDSLIVGMYENDELSGAYRVYIDTNVRVEESRISTDTSELALLLVGSHINGKKSGLWRYYYSTGTLRKEGSFLAGEEVGEWKYYFDSIRADDGSQHRCSNQLYMVRNYSDGKLNGRAVRTAILEDVKFLCQDLVRTSGPSDTCRRLICHNVFEMSEYKNGLRNGNYELRDSLNSLIAKGSFKDDLRDGEWQLRSDGFINVNRNSYQKGSYIKDLKEGRWFLYDAGGNIAEIFNYKNDTLHGEYFLFDGDKRLREKKLFINGKLKDLFIYDSFGISPILYYEIYENGVYSLKCRRTEYFATGNASQEFYIIKNDIDIDHRLFESKFLESLDNNLIEGINGYRDGEFRRWDTDMEPALVTGKYLKYDRVGLWTSYYYNQNVKVESNYILGQLINEKYYTLKGQLFSGVFVHYNKENGIKEERRIKNGIRNGKTIYMDATTGQVVKREKYKKGVSI